MELANIEKLLEKYLEAETSIQEEALLQDYFSQDNIAPHLYEYKALFAYFGKSKAERFTKTIPLKPRSTNWKWLSVAAAVVLLFSVYSIQRSSTGLSVKEEQEALMALQETQKAFQLISQNLNKGENAAIAGLSEFDKAQRKIFKTKK